MARRTNTGQSTTTTSNEGLADDNGSSTQSPGGGGVVDSAKQAASQAASQAKETASHVIDQAKDQAASQVDQGRQTLASGLGSVAQAFQSMGNRLRNQDEGPIAQYAAEMGQAMGGQVERLANYLQGRNMQELLNDVEGFARRSPAVFLGSAFVLGLAASRFLKSSRPAPDYSTRVEDPAHLLPPASARTGNEVGANA
ncbi:MAG: hypothetical protein JOY85_17765 [Acidobacteriaceae bacterium]|nr:hypothetical protein [Acidobacteriaceae bacterium]